MIGRLAIVGVGTCAWWIAPSFGVTVYGVIGAYVRLFT